MRWGRCVGNLRRRGSARGGSVSSCTGGGYIGRHEGRREAARVRGVVSDTVTPGMVRSMSGRSGADRTGTVLSTGEADPTAGDALDKEQLRRAVAIKGDL